MFSAGSEQFKAGESFSVGGVDVRLVSGRKAARAGEDVRVDIRTMGGAWTPVKFELVALLVIALYENEDRLYPPGWPKPNGGVFEGRKKTADYLRACLKDGWRVATQRLNDEIERARRRAA